MIKGIIFVLDGTLADTIEDLAEAMNYALKQVQCPQLRVGQCRQMVGGGLKNFVAQALPQDRQDIHSTLLDLMVNYYRDNCLSKTKAYAGILETLQRLYDKGILLAVLTNKNQIPAEVIVYHLFGKTMFSQIVGAAEGRKVKPDPKTTLDIISTWGLDKSEVLYVGDSDIDIRTAHAVGIQSAACLWGYRSRQQLKDAGATVFIQHPEELLELLS
jgi:phosphoglycolate phosphatase